LFKYCLWLSSPIAAGAGKTFLVSTVIEHLEALARAAAPGSVSVAFIYCRYTDRTPVRDILAALVRQLLERNHSLLYLIEPLFEQHSLERTQPNQHELLDVLANISEVVKTNFFVLEGLDEALPDAQFDLLEALASLNANTFITSRPLQQLEAQAEEWSAVEFFNVTATDEDLDLFLSHRFSRSASLQRLLSDKQFRNEVLSQIRSKSDGMCVPIIYSESAIAD
jgi:ankyrin repeat domain-containing protein 50